MRANWLDVQEQGRNRQGLSVTVHSEVLIKKEVAAPKSTPSNSNLQLRISVEFEGERF